MSAIDLNARPSKDFDAKLAQTSELLRGAINQHGEQITQANSLGAEDMVISHLAKSLGLRLPIFVLETGMLHAETLQLLEQLKASNPGLVSVFTPKTESAIEFVARQGKDAMYKSVELRKSCCHIRKMEPLERALDGKTAWVTGLRREQSGDRADVPLTDTSGPRTKYNPLAGWTWGDVWHYIAQNKVSYNPLHDQFFPSIGCAPCTRAISLGEDFRAGRWWWEEQTQKECGLHTIKTP